MKKFFKVLLTLAIAAASVPMMAAFEAHVINVLAQIENTLTVSSQQINFGRVYPQIEKEERFSVNLSESFLSDRNVDDVEYIIRQKPKCAITSNDGKQVDAQYTATGHVSVDPQGNVITDCGNPPRTLLSGEAWGPLPVLCNYLSKHKQPSESPENDNELDAFHQMGYVNDNSTPNDPSDDFWSWTEVGGRLAKSEQDFTDTWVLDLKTPCFEKHCAQDWEEFVKKANRNADPALYIESADNQGKYFGCDLWVEVTRVSPSDSGGPDTYCGDGIKQNPNDAGTGGPNNDGNEACDGTDGVGIHQRCNSNCVLVDLTYCGDGAKQTPNNEGTGGPNNDGNEACDGTDGVTQGFSCTNNCVLEPLTECTPGQTRACDTGLLGICSAGTQTCVEPGNWGSCVQNQQPIQEQCTNGVDDDCDGFIDGDDTDCQQACFDKTDIMLVLDRSNSIDSSEMASLKNAAHSFVTAIDPTTENNHMGQSNFSTYGHLDLHLTGNKTQIDNAIDSLKSGAFTNLMEGIVYASNELADSHTTHERPSIPDFMIIITDGNPNRPVNSATARAQAKAAADNAKAAGIAIYVVGVGSDVDATYLKTIASGDDHYYPVADYASLSDTLGQIANCQ